MNKAQVKDTLTSLDGAWATPNRVRLLARLSQIYEREGVLTAEKAPPLHRACPDAESCWEGNRNRASVRAEGTWSGDSDGCVFWPWIGEQYRPGGVCVVGDNLNHRGDRWSITGEYAIAAEADARFIDGYKRLEDPKSMFPYGSVATAMAVLDSIDGREPIEQPTPQLVPAARERIARLQAVKCSPLGGNSRPTATMCVRCPRRFLTQELAVLRPGAIVVLGDVAGTAIDEAGEISWEKWRQGYVRGTLAPGTADPVSVFALRHPSSSGWYEAQAALVRDLIRRPVGTNLAQP